MFFKNTCCLGWTALLTILLGLTHITGEYSTQDVVEGKRLNLFCQGAITPGGRVFWQNSQKTFRKDGKSLIINHVTRNFTDEYVCFELTPTTGKTREIFHVFVNVIYPAKILSIDMKNDTANGNETFSMTVNVEGNPLPEIKVTQLRTGKVIYNGTKDGTVTIGFTVYCFDNGTYALTCSNSLNFARMPVNIKLLFLDVVPAADHSTGRVSHILTQLTRDTIYIVQIQSSSSKGNATSLSNRAKFTTAALPTIATTPARSGVRKATLSMAVTVYAAFLCILHRVVM